jgi:hypothetical protein
LPSIAPTEATDAEEDNGESGHGHIDANDAGWLIMRVMDKAAWDRLLSVWAAEAVKRAGVKPTAGPFSGLGLPGVAEAELLVAEGRLGCRLPPSYREFLKCTNGLRQPLEFVAARGGDFWPAEEIERFRVRKEAWFFANWGPGAYRHQSFAEMMLAHYEGFQSEGLDGF